MSSLYLSDVTLNHNVPLILIVMYSFSLCESFCHKSHYISFYIPFGATLCLVDPFTAYCFASIRNYFWVPNIIDNFRFHFILHGFRPLQRVIASHSFFKWGGINFHLNFTTINFIIIRKSWFPYSLRPSGPLTTSTSFI
jgi:hypothetical protein